MPSGLDFPVVALVPHEYNIRILNYGDEDCKAVSVAVQQEDKYNRQKGGIHIRANYPKYLKQSGVFAPHVLPKPVEQRHRGPRRPPSVPEGHRGYHPYGSGRTTQTSSAQPNVRVSDHRTDPADQ